MAKSSSYYENSLRNNFPFWVIFSSSNENLIRQTEMTATRKNNPDSTPSASGTEIYDEVQKLATSGMDQLLKRFFSKLSETTFEHLSSRDTDRLIAQITRKEDIILSSFLFNLKNNFADFKVSRQFRFQQIPAANDQVLGLVGTNQYSEFNEIESIVSRFDHKYTPFYVSLADHLANSINRDEVDGLDNPLHAKNICFIFQSAISSLNLVNAQKVALYKVFANLVIERLEPLYIELQECFIRHQPVENPNPMPIDTIVREEIKSNEPDKSAAMSHIPVLIGIFQAFKDKANTRDYVFSNLLPELKANLEQKGITEFDSLIDELSVIFGIVFADKDLPQRIKQQLARLQIFVFMSEIQQSGFAVRSSHPARRLIDTIVRTEVDFEKNSQSGRSGCELLRAEIDKVSSNPFLEPDYYSQLCQRYIEHIAEGSGATSLEKTSPLIDTAALHQAETAETGQPEIAQKQQESGIDFATNESNTVDIVLETEKTARANSKVDNIYAVVHSIVNDIALPLKMQGRSLILFDEVWFPLLLKVAEKQGFKSQAWHKIITIAKTHSWVLTPKNNQSDLDKLKLTQPQIEKSLSQSMRSLSMPAEQQSSLLEFLQHELEDVFTISKEQIKENNRAQVKSRKIEPKAKSTPESSAKPAEDHNDDTIFEFSNLMETGRFKKSQDMLEALQFDSKTIAQKDKPSIKATNIHKGDWVEIKKGSATVLAKLTWKDEQARQFIFVDREGHRVCDISREELDSELAKGNISLISSTPVRSQRASFSIIQTIK